MALSDTVDHIGEPGLRTMYISVRTSVDRKLLLSFLYATFLSYGLDGFSTLEDMAAYFREEYAEHLEVLQNADRIIIDRKFAFVHAGIEPEVSLEQQSDYDLMWIRDKFLDFEGPLPLVFVHGHTPAKEPIVRSNKIGIDTGAYKYGELTCLAISPDQSEFNFIVAKTVEGQIFIEKTQSHFTSSI